MSSFTIEKRTVASQVAAMIRTRILSGVYEAGCQLRQEHIADEIGVSRIPVREALQQLHAEGFLTVVPHRGAIVSEVSLEEILELYELRARLETWLLGLAIPNMDGSILDRAKLHADAFAGFLDDPGKSHEANWAFHATLYAPAHRRATMELLEKIHQKIERYTRMMVTLTRERLNSAEQHGALLELCRRKDVVRAVALLDLHIMEGSQFLVEKLTELRKSRTAEQG